MAIGTATNPTSTVWINSVELVKAEKPKRGRREYLLASSANVIHAGRNVLAVQVMPVAGNHDILLDVRLDEIRSPSAKAGSGEITEKPVTQLAVVCDLCSSLPSGPACVHACPHEAALRVNACSNG